MKLRATNAARFMRLMPAVLPMIWGPALCLAMLNTPVRPRPGIATTAPTRDPFSSVYAGILSPIQPAGTLSHERSCSASRGIPAEWHDASIIHKPAFPLTWAAVAGVQKPAHSFALCPGSAHRASDLNSVFNALYTVNRSSGIANRRIPKLLSSYWGSLALPSSGSAISPRTGLTRHSQDLAKLAGPFGKVPIADLVKANIFRLVSLASW